MILNEDYGNLNKIDTSFLKDADDKPINLSTRNSTISPNSEIIIDKNIKPHTVDGFLKLLDDQSNTCIIMRIFNRQMFLLTREGRIYTKFPNALTVVLTPFVERLLDNSHKVLSYGSKKDVKEFLNRLFFYLKEKYKDKFGKRINWDVMIIKSDAQNKLDKKVGRDMNRHESHSTPKDKDYEDFIYKLEMRWKQKCQDYLESHLSDNKSPQEVIQYLMKRSSIDTFMLNGIKYVKSDSDLVWLKRENDITYKRQPLPENDGKYNFIKIKVNYKGFNPTITGIYGSTSMNNVYDSWEELS